MSFKIIEKNIIPKANLIEYCEDKIVYNSYFACIIDGATTKSSVLYDNKKSGLLVSEILEKAILNLEKTSNLTQTIDSLTKSIRDFYIANNIIEKVKNNPIDRLTAAIVIYSSYYNQIWMIGDCQCMVDNKLYLNNKLIDRLLSETRAFYIEKELIDGKTIEDLQKFDTGREYILPLLKSQLYFQNNRIDSEYSYCVVDGFKINISQIKVIDTNNAKNIVLASDGYPKLFNNLNETEKYLNYVIKNDPLCYNLYKSTKGKGINMVSYDDRAYLRLELK